MIWRETVENHGVRIHTPIDLAQLIGEARKDGLPYEVWPFEEGQEFGVLVGPWGNHSQSLYFSDGKPVFYGITDGKRIRGVVTCIGCTFEAELRDGQLNISTTMRARGRRRFLRRIESGKII